MMAVAILTPIVLSLLAIIFSVVAIFRSFKTKAWMLYVLLSACCIILSFYVLFLWVLGIGLSGDMALGLSAVFFICAIVMNVWLSKIVRKKMTFDPQSIHVQFLGLHPMSDIKSGNVIPSIGTSS